jgi:2,4-dienoyl-CoA reductase-like NADH-dependent reductase (Old Yellow Enzyme family)
MTDLFSPLTIKKITLRNRIGVPPMCQYSAQDGFATDWHLAHYGAFAQGGAGLVIMEATAVEPEGRISPDDLGLWKDEQVAALASVASFIKAQGAVPGIQIAHAGRKASTRNPWAQPDKPAPLGKKEGGWIPKGASAIAFDQGWPVPEELIEDELNTLAQAFAEAARRAAEAGIEWLEIHMAHGYLLHSFMSPLSNKRTDDFGGGLNNRLRFPLMVAKAVRKAWPQDLPLSARLSCTDWAPEGGWDLESSVALARHLKSEGFDLIDCSSGGSLAKAEIPLGPGYQLPFSDAIRRQAQIATAGVGMITEPAQADQVIRNQQADIVLLGRESLRNPHWPHRAALALRHKQPVMAPQYSRA